MPEESFNLVMNSWPAIYLIFFFSLTVFSCSSDAGKTQDQDEGTQTEEEKYFEDYEPPRFRWGYINMENRLVIEDRFDACREFSEGLAAANEHGLWGYINQVGEFVIEPIYRSAYSFHDQIARAQLMDKSFVFLDPNGKELLYCPYPEVYDMMEGLARVRQDQGYNYIRIDGEKLLSQPVSAGRNFQEGYAVIENGGRYGLIDRHGKFVLDTEYTRISDVKNGIAQIEQGESKGYFDAIRTTKWLKKMDSFTSVQKGRGFAKFGNTWHMIDAELKELGKVSHPHIDAIQYAGNERWRIATQTGFGLIDRNGKILCKPDYDIIYDFSEGRAGFLKNRLWGMMDIEGREVIPPSFGLIWDFHEGLARAAASGGIGFINKDGKFVIDPVHYEVRDFSNGLARVQVYR